MNKRELIKALFKDPTIKALYESGQFNAADINRAILSEASIEEVQPKSVAQDIRRKTSGLSPAELLAALEERMEIYEKATQWADLKKLHPRAAKKDPETWKQWEATDLQTIIKNLGERIKDARTLVQQSKDADDDGDGIPDNENTRQEIQNSTDEIVDQVEKDTKTIDQNIQNAGSEEGGELIQPKRQWQN